MSLHKVSTGTRMKKHHNIRRTFNSSRSGLHCLQPQAHPWEIPQQAIRLSLYRDTHKRLFGTLIKDDSAKHVRMLVMSIVFQIFQPLKLQHNQISIFYHCLTVVLSSFEKGVTANICKFCTVILN